MSKPPVYWYKAKKILSRRDPVLKKIIKKFNKGFLTTRDDPFFSLCRTIVGQQISTKAADSIWLKFEKKSKKRIRPHIILKLPSRSLKKVGLSRQKISYLKNIAKSFKNKSFEIEKLKKMSDEESINYITKLRGLGVWSAQMFLMFNLNRPDIFPTTDIGLLKSISKNYKVSYPPSKRFLNKISKLHFGHRTIFTWYMWRSIDSSEVEY
ncbi:MAG: DNA-3-methyladenine glycosylase 2 family protein [Pelagibacteraceae bacterium]|jgi:DNA-3-methyladenine glycosylase II|nr:DNA-3-methyladenine glycosylase 2 family protein [Pelagibacteraceae bacterium]|tara:strand:+ start:15352 stop:15978 length:627 start_codon:yes stop_codon:yes gene_type:complete